MKTPKSARPLGHQVLVELLTAQETLGTSLMIETECKVDTPQGYVVAVGKMVPPDFEVKVGDRVFLSASDVVMPPVKSENGRQLCCMSYNGIKGVLED